MSELVFDSVSTSNVYPNACRQCRTRKLKCTKQAPCSNCLQKSYDCIYDNVRGLRGRKPKANAPPESLQLSEPTSQSNQNQINTPISNEDDAVLFTQHSDAMLQSDSGFLGDLPYCEQVVPGISSNVDAQNVPVQPQPFPINDLSMAAVDWGLWWPGSSMDLECDLPDLLSQDEATQSPRGDPDRYPLSLVVDEEILQKAINIYLTSIHPTRPFFRASLIQDGMSCKKYRFNQGFASMVLAIGAFTLLHYHPQELSTSNNGIPLSTEMMSQAIRLHSTSVLGQVPTFEALQTSVYIFAVLWNLKQESAAWLRLHEAIGLFKLYCPVNIEEEGPPGALGATDWSDKARVYLELVVLERVFAIRAAGRYKLSLPPLSALLLQKLSSFPTEYGAENEIMYSSDYSMLVLIGETIGLVDDTTVTCLRNDCGNKGQCTGLSREHILSLLERQRDWEGLELKHHNGTVKLYLDVGTVPMPFDIFPDGNNECGILIGCLWIRNRLWRLALTHGHVSPSDLETKLSIYYPIRIAGCAFALLKSFRIGSLESSPDAMVHQLFDIAFDFLYAATEIRIKHTRPDILDMKFDLPSVSGLSSGDNMSLDSMILRTGYAKSATVSVSGIANGLLGFFASFNNGDHPRFKDYMDAYQVFMGKR